MCNMYNMCIGIYRGDIYKVHDYILYQCFLYLIIYCTLPHEMPHHGTKDSSRVTEQFHLGNPFDPKDPDRRVTWAHAYEALPLKMGV